VSVKSPKHPYLAEIEAQAQQLFTRSAFEQAWKKYQVGEVNSFSEGIYSDLGRSLLKLTQSRLQSEPAFRDSANIFMAEFEGEVKNKASGNNAQAAVKTLLASNRGQVYTLLAHGSGIL
jgi:hypothetical protein